MPNPNREPPKGSKPLDTPPKCIVKHRNGKYTLNNAYPTPGSHFQYYIDVPTIVTFDQLRELLKDKEKRWFSTDKETYALAKEVGANMKDESKEPWAALTTMQGDKTYWVGRRYEMPPPETSYVVVSVGEMYLKSKLHRSRMYRAAMESIIRVVGHPHVVRCGDSSIEVRHAMPTEEQLDTLALLPGLANISLSRHHPDVIKERRAKGDMTAGTPNDSMGFAYGPPLRHGTGGLPVLKDQPVLALMSGGIDSPVAAYKMITRGCYVSGVHFLNSTNDTGSVMDKNRLIAKRLSQFQGQFTMKFVDISLLQAQIVAKIDNMNRTAMYKWFMLHIGTLLDDSLFVVVGDSIGQVASQTVANIYALYSTQQNKPVIAPLIGSHKMDIVDVARKIGTFDYSIMEGADCCQYMMCKTGANLVVGKSTIRKSVSLISPCELPVTSERYRNGELVDTQKSTFSLVPPAPYSLGYNVAIAKNIKKSKGGEEGGAAAVTTDATGAEGEDEEDVGKGPVYFDAAATTVPHPSVVAAMAKAPIGNPNSLHQTGRAARMAIERVRADIAAMLRLPSKDIIFTSGGTESNNLALMGYTVEREEWSHPSTIGNRPELGLGTIKVIDLVHHETGSVAPPSSLKKPDGATYRLHVDACQALCKIDFSAYDFSDVDSIAMTGQKINGPLGAGILYMRDCKQRMPLLFGGSQEGAVRPGTENVPAIVGLGAALQLDRSRSIHTEVEEYLIQSLEKLNCTVNRRGNTSGYIVHATLPEGYNNVDFVSYLSAHHNVEIGTGSACKSTDTENVSTYKTLGINPIPARRSIRLSYDAFVKQDQAERVISAITDTLKHFAPK